MPQGIGVLIDSGKYNSGQLVEWTDGSKTVAAERHLVIVPDEETQAD